MKGKIVLIWSLSLSALCEPDQKIRCQTFLWTNNRLFSNISPITNPHLNISLKTVLTCEAKIYPWSVKCFEFAQNTSLKRKHFSYLQKKKKKGEARALRVFEEVEEVEEAEEAKEDEANEENEGLIEEVDSLDDLPACCIPS